MLPRPKVQLVRQLWNYGNQGIQKMVIFLKVKFIKANSSCTPPPAGMVYNAWAVELYTTTGICPDQDFDVKLDMKLTSTENSSIYRGKGSDSLAHLTYVSTILTMGWSGDNGIVSATRTGTIMEFSSGECFHRKGVRMPNGYVKTFGRDAFTEVLLESIHIRVKKAWDVAMLTREYLQMYDQTIKSRKELRAECFRARRLLRLAKRKPRNINHTLFFRVAPDLNS